jgi:hypothetical protein
MTPNGDGDFDDAGELTPMATDTTSGGASYAFTNQFPGNYQVYLGEQLQWSVGLEDAVLDEYGCQRQRRGQ